MRDKVIIEETRTPLVVKLHAPNKRGMGLILGQGRSHMPQKKKKKNTKKLKLYK